MSYEAALTALLEPATPGSVFRPSLPVGSPLPAQTHRRIDTEHEYAHDGDAGIRVARVQVDVWAGDPDQADAIANAGPRSLTGYSDGFFQSIEIVGDRDLDEPENGIFRRSIDLMVTYEEVLE